MWETQAEEKNIILKTENITIKWGLSQILFEN